LETSKKIIAKKLFIKNLMLIQRNFDPYFWKKLSSLPSLCSVLNSDDLESLYNVIGIKIFTDTLQKNY